ncbi:hypothetical protein [Devosia sp. CAU 1758]
MPTITAALAALERYTGFSQSRSRTVARRLQEAGILPLGSPGSTPLLDRAGFGALFVALAADTTLHAAADRVRQYFALTPGGVSLEGAPTLIGTARSELLALIDTAIDAPDDLRHVQIELVSNFPELALHWADGTVQRYQPVGTVSNHWQTDTHRKSTTVTGRAFRDAVRATFMGAR